MQVFWDTLTLASKMAQTKMIWSNPIYVSVNSNNGIGSANETFSFRRRFYNLHES